MEPPALGVVKSVTADSAVIAIAEEAREVTVPFASIDLAAGTWTEPPAAPVDASPTPPAPMPAIDAEAAAMAIMGSPPTLSMREARAMSGHHTTDDRSPVQAVSVPAVASLPPVPASHELALWTGAGRYGGPYYTFPAREERPHCVGKTLGYFPSASVKKLRGMFEHPGATPPVGEPGAPRLSPAPAGAEGPPPVGYLLAYWTGLGRFAGQFLTFPERKLLKEARGRTLGYFPEASVRKLAAQFERVG